MKSKFNYFIFIGLLLLSVSCLANKNQSAKTYQNFKKPIVLANDIKTFVIKFKSNRTTGYQWFLQRYNKKLITPIKYQYIPSKSDLVGAGGDSLWWFKVKPGFFVVPQLIKLKFIYARPWDIKSGEEKKIFIISTGH